MPRTEGESDVGKELQRANRWHTLEKIAFLNALRDRFGLGVLEVVDQVIAERAQRFGRRVAQREGGSSIDDLLRIFWEPERTQGLEYTTQRTADGVQIRCTRCPMHDLARDIGETEWMYRLVCAADPHVATGFNPKMGLRRTRTLMQGHNLCNHFYYLKP